jgi:hypothetical protein
MLRTFLISPCMLYVQPIISSSDSITLIVSIWSIRNVFQTIANSSSSKTLFSPVPCSQTTSTCDLPKRHSHIKILLKYIFVFSEFICLDGKKEDKRLWTELLESFPEFNVFLKLIIQVLTAANMKVTAFWHMAPCRIVEVDRRFRGAYCLPSSGRWRHISEHCHLHDVKS